jgi:hypothetical protein
MRSSRPRRRRLFGGRALSRTTPPPEIVRVSPPPGHTKCHAEHTSYKLDILYTLDELSQREYVVIKEMEKFN